MSDAQWDGSGGRLDRSYYQDQVFKDPDDSVRQDEGATMRHLVETIETAGDRMDKNGRGFNSSLPGRNASAPSNLENGKSHGPVGGVALADIVEVPRVAVRTVDVVRMGGTYSSFTTPTRELVESCITQVLAAIGLDASDPELAETPRRVTDLLEEFSQKRDLTSVLGDGFNHNGSSDGQRGLVAQYDIPFRALCAHHWAPFHGHAHIGYIPQRKMVGLSKLTRLVQAAGTTQPSSQETITNTIADVLHQWAEGLGVIIVTSAIHSCMCSRGVNAPGVETKVSACRGVFLTNPAARQEFFSMYGLR